jgi:hypothetical protein
MAWYREGRIDLGMVGSGTALALVGRNDRFQWLARAISHRAGNHLHLKVGEEQHLQAAWDEAIRRGVPEGELRACVEIQKTVRLLPPLKRQRYADKIQHTPFDWRTALVNWRLPAFIPRP